jgi:hypothetical protein
MAKFLKTLPPDENEMFPVFNPSEAIRKFNIFLNSNPKKQ